MELDTGAALPWVDRCRLRHDWVEMFTVDTVS